MPLEVSACVTLFYRRFLRLLANAEKHAGPVSSEDEFVVVTGIRVPDHQSVVKTARDTTPGWI